MAAVRAPIGRMRSFFGNVGILLRGYCYLKTLGAQGLRDVSDNAVLNANYLKSKVADILPAEQGEHCKLGVHVGINFLFLYALAYDIPKHLSNFITCFAPVLPSFRVQAGFFHER